jgi:hypothetical protein
VPAIFNTTYGDLLAEVVAPVDTAGDIVEDVLAKTGADEIDKKDKAKMPCTNNVRMLKVPKS